MIWTRKNFMEKTVWQQRHGSVIFSGQSAGIMIFPANWILTLFRKRKKSLFMMPSNREPLPVSLMEAFGLYLVKKIYLGAEEGQLMGIAQLCLDEASFSKVAAERPGVPDIRKKAFEGDPGTGFWKTECIFCRQAEACLSSQGTDRRSGRRTKAPPGAGSG